MRAMIGEDDGFLVLWFLAENAAMVLWFFLVGMREKMAQWLGKEKEGKTLVSWR